jgi:subtilisin
MSASTRFLILPPPGLQTSSGNTGQFKGKVSAPLVLSAEMEQVRQELRTTVRPGAVRGKKRSRGKAQSVPEGGFELVATIEENGVQLVSATPEIATAYRFVNAGVRVVPEVFYEPASFVPQLRAKTTTVTGGTATPVHHLEVEVVRMDTQQPVRGVKVVGFTNFERREGAKGETRTNGKITLSVPDGHSTYERVYIQHELAGLWSHLFRDQSTQGTLRAELRSLDLGAKDSLRHFHNLGQLADGQGVKVGVVDSGVASDHPDLQVRGGWGCVPGEPYTDWGPHGNHGTHVAGIIAGRGAAPKGVRGMAPGVEIFSYRVFGPSRSSGSNFAIVQAIERGIADSCDLLNLSLSFRTDRNTGQVSIDLAVQDYIRKAYDQGILIIAAAGNDGREPVRYPGSDALAVAVSAVGRKGLFPADAAAQGDVMFPYGTDPDDFVAAFSNVGTEIDVAGAGVAVISTVPGRGYAAMSGTSMACPAVTGVVARLLAKDQTVLKMPRNAQRATAIKSLLFGHARSLGFKIDLEGKGLPK